MKLTLIILQGSIDVYAYPSTESVGTQTPIASIQGHQTGRRAWLQTMIEIPNQSANFTVALAANQQALSSDVYAIDDVSITQGACSAAGIVILEVYKPYNT